ncbi:hypothetical protein SDC9_112085 [bioreactor metagenome]|uniref:Uncharacterized protein n=1 Tax=bioreactor metagenome TaxID=1076179 RepID=A0A645BPP3_9ZZZZ
MKKGNVSSAVLLATDESEAERHAASRKRVECAAERIANVASEVGLTVPELRWVMTEVEAKLVVARPTTEG